MQVAESKSDGNPVKRQPWLLSHFSVTRHTQSTPTESVSNRSKACFSRVCEYEFSEKVRFQGWSGEGLATKSEFVFEFKNHSGIDWTQVSLAASCKCSELSVEDRKDKYVDGDMLRIRVVVAEPKSPAVTKATVQVNVNGRVLTVPVLVVWQSPILDLKLSQKGEHVWELSFLLRSGLKCESLSLLDSSFTAESNGLCEGRCIFAIRSTSNDSRSSSAVLRLSGQQLLRSPELTLPLYFESSGLRVSPQVVLASVTKEGRFSGRFRILGLATESVEVPCVKKLSMSVGSQLSSALALNSEKQGLCLWHLAVK